MVKNYLANLKGKKLAAETTWSFLTKGVTMLLFFGIDIALTRTLGSAYGTWSYFFSALTIMMLIAAFGVNGAVRAFSAKYNNTARMPGIFYSGILLRIVLTLSTIALFYIGRNLIADIFNRNSFALLLAISFPLLFLSNIVEFYKQLFSGLHKIKYAFLTNLSEYGSKLLVVLLIAVVPTIQASVESTIFAYTAGVLIAAIIATIVGLTYIKKQPKAESGNPTFVQNAREIFHYSIPLFIISIGLIVATEVDTVLLGRLNGDEAAGIYSVAKKIITKLPQISLAISAGVMPIFAKMTSDTVKKDKTLFYKLLRVNTYIFIPIVLLIASTSWFFIPLLYGTEYSASVIPLNLLLIYLLIYSYSIYLSIFLDYRKLARKRAFNLSIAIVLNIILDIVLIPEYGPSGAAIATSVSYIPYIALNWREVQAEFKRIS